MGGNKRKQWSPCNVMRFRKLYTEFHSSWCMEEYPTACNSGAPDQYFQIKDKKTGLVLSHSELPTSHDVTLVFAENAALGGQIWSWYKTFDADPADEYSYLVSRLTPRKAIKLQKETCNQEFCQVALKEETEMGDQKWKQEGDKIVSMEKGRVLAELDGNLVALKAGSDTTLTVEKAPPEQNPLVPFLAIDCPAPPSPPLGAFVLRNQDNQYLMSGESGNVILVKEECGDRGHWLWERDDDTWGIIRHQKTGRVLTANTSNQKLHLAALNPDGKNQRWRQVSNNIVSKVLKGPAVQVLKFDQDKNLVIDQSIKDDPNQSWEIILDSQTSPPPQPPKGYFTIKNKLTGESISIQDRGLALTASTCGKLDQFVWVPAEGGVYGSIMSKTTQQYLSTSAKNRGIYMRDKDSSSIFQKWRIDQNQLVSAAKTIDNEPGVLAYDIETNQLLLRKMECNKLDDKWELEEIEPSLNKNKIPEDGAFGIEDDNGLWLSVRNGKVIMTASDCDMPDQQWLWEWDDDGEFGLIVPKQNPTLALDLLRRKMVVRLKTKGQGDNQMWRLLGNSITSKLLPTFALTVDTDGSLRADYLDCNAKNQNLAIVRITCDLNDIE